MASKPNTVIIIDDHDIVRNGLRNLIEGMGNFKVIDEYNNGLVFVKKLNQLKTIPDIFILDYSMPMMNGVEVLKEVIEINKSFKFLLLTQHLEEDIIDQAYVNGARGFLHKTCSMEELKSTMNEIINIGYSNISNILNRIRHFQMPKSQPKIELNERELELIKLICDKNEYTYHQIADLMNVSVKTIDKYRGVLFTKLNVKSKTGIVLYSHKHKLTQPFI